MPRKYKKHSRRSRKSYRKSRCSRRRSRKSKSRRIKKNPNNPCSMRSAKTCGGDPNCHYVKRRGCARKSGVKKGSVVYEGPRSPF